MAVISLSLSLSLSLSRSRLYIIIDMSSIPDFFLSLFLSLLSVSLSVSVSVSLCLSLSLYFYSVCAFVYHLAERLPLSAAWAWLSHRCLEWRTNRQSSLSSSCASNNINNQSQIAMTVRSPWGIAVSVICCSSSKTGRTTARGRTNLWRTWLLWKKGGSYCYPRPLPKMLWCSHNFTFS